MQKTGKNEQEPTPEKIFEISFSFAPNRVLVAGVDLEVFTHIANGRHTAGEIAQAASASLRGMEMLLNSLTGLGFLSKSNGSYHLVPVSEMFLVKNKPSYNGDFVQHSDGLWESWGNLTDIVRTGKPYTALNEEQGVEFFQKLVVQLFPMSYPGARVAAEALGVGREWKGLEILDVAAGSGAWSIAFAERDPDTKVTVQDWPDIIEVAKNFVERFKLSDRYSYLAGDLNDVDFGKEKFDLVILGHICHSEGEANSRKLISRAYRALKPGGKLLIAEMVPDDERKSEVFPLLFALNMLIHSTDGNTFTMKEYREWLTESGFNDIKTIDAPGPSPLIVAGK